MMARITPPYGVTGLWKVKAPFTVKIAKEYTCIALRSIADMELRGMDTYKQVYAPAGLRESDYSFDSGQSVVIVSLLASDGELLHIPDTYILSYPDMNIGSYTRYILSAELGTLPTGTQLNHISQNIAGRLQEMLGRAVTVRLHTGAIKPDNLTPAERKLEENNRKANITNKTTIGGQLMVLNRQYGELKTYVKVLEARTREKDGRIRELEAQVRRLGGTP